MAPRVPAATTAVATTLSVAVPGTTARAIGVVTLLAARASTRASGAPRASATPAPAREATTPIALAVVPGTATDSVVATAVVAAGTLGAIAVPALARRAGLARPVPLGLGMGVVAHAIGTAELAKRSPRAVGYGVAGLVLNGVVTAVWLPPLLRAL